MSLSIFCLSAASFALKASSQTLNLEAENNLVIYSVLSNKAARPLLSAFTKLYPNITLKYDGDSSSNEINSRFESDIQSSGVSADVMWSSAIDTQMKYVKNGFSLAYSPKEAFFLPSWAKYKNLAWGTTFEPVVMVYNSKTLPLDRIPKDHSDLISLLKSHRQEFNGKVTMFDSNLSSVGMFFKAQDFKTNPQSNLLYQALIASKVVVAGGTGEMLTKINSGEFDIGYNIMGSYAKSRSQRDLTNLAVIYPSDYTLVLTRVAFISKFAKNPKAAQLWIDFLLSQEGQKILADEVELNSIRSDIDSPNTAQALANTIGKGVTPVAINE